MTTTAAVVNVVLINGVAHDPDPHYCTHVPRLRAKGHDVSEPTDVDALTLYGADRWASGKGPSSKVARCFQETLISTLNDAAV